MSDDDFKIRPGRSRDAGKGAGRKARSLAAQVRRAAARAGFARRRPGRMGGTGHKGRGRIARLCIPGHPRSRRVVIKTRLVRHKGARFRAAPLARHVAYLRRDGVTRDGHDADLFDAASDHADGDAFAGRCEEDRHHFRFIISPEDAGDLADLRTFTRELMEDVARDLDTELDWVAVDHWNTDNPHIHLLLRGRADDGQDLVIDRDYIREGMRRRAEQRATLELGPRSEHDIRTALEREVDADRWTSLDDQLQQRADPATRLIDLRPGDERDADRRLLLVGRADKLARLGLCEEVETGLWSLRPDAEETLRALSIRGDIIKTMHQAMSRDGRSVDPGRFALHAAVPSEPIIGRLVERGLHDELGGSAFAVIDGTDGRTHHVRFGDLEMTGDAAPGAIVEVRAWQDAKGAPRLSLATRSDLPLAAQITAPGATWLDRQLIAQERLETRGGFGAEVREALDARTRELQARRLAQVRGGVITFERDLIETLRRGELTEAVAAIAARLGRPHRPSAEGDAVSGTYRERVTLSSGRFALVDDGVGFQLVPWRPALEPHLGGPVTGRVGPGGLIDWSMGRSQGLGL